MSNSIDIASSDLRQQRYSLSLETARVMNQLKQAFGHGEIANKKG